MINLMSKICKAFCKTAMFPIRIIVSVMIVLAVCVVAYFACHGFIDDNGSISEVSSNEK